MKMRRYLKYVIYLLVLAVLLFGLYGAYLSLYSSDISKLTEAEEKFVKENSPIQVGVDMDFVPYEFVDSQGQVQGLTVDFLHLVSIHTGINLEFIPGTWAKTIERLRAGEVDMINNVTPTPARDKFMQYSSQIELFDQTSSIYVLQYVVDVKDLGDLKGHLIGAKKATSVTNKIKKHEDVKLKEYPTSAGLLEALLAGEVDVVVDYDYPFQYQLFKKNINKVKKTPGIFHREPGTFAVRRENGLLLSIINKGMASVSDEEKQNLKVKWFGGPELFSEDAGGVGVTCFLRKYYLYFVGVSLLVLFLFFWNFTLRKQVDSATENLQESKSALKKSLKQKEILLKEVHHRVKNNLFTIVSLLEMQRLRSEQPEVQRMLTQAVNRVHSMALIHQKIYSSQDIEQLDFAEYLHELVENLLDSTIDPERDIEVEYNLSHSSLDIDRIIPCALIVNELVTNALVHGFDDREEGILRLRYDRLEEEYVIAVENNGRPLGEDFEIENSSSLGLKLVQGLAEEQLGGRIEVSSNGFMSFKITFPINRLETEESSTSGL
jgi:two-component sensor histidine kinase/ABC-type amino acid transport substrate-binding protein